jgi:hypothetical protein
MVKISPGGGGAAITTTTPTTQAHGDSAAVGADGKAADGLHKHAMPDAGGRAILFSQVFN